jgi:hypothetical protein
MVEVLLLRETLGAALTVSDRTSGKRAKGVPDAEMC